MLKLMEVILGLCEPCRQCSQTIVLEMAYELHITMQGVNTRAVKEEMAWLYGKGIGILYTIDGSPFLYDNRHTAIEHLTHLTDKKVGHLVGLPV